MSRDAPKKPETKPYKPVVQVPTDPPDNYTTVQGRRPVLGTGDVPRELSEFASAFPVLIESADDSELVVQSERIGDPGGRLWRVNSSIAGDYRIAPTAVQTRRREEPEVLRGEIDDSVTTEGFRPPWLDLLYTPRLAPPSERPEIVRLNGRRVDPLWVFGNDDRYVFKDSAWPWGLVGSIHTNATGVAGHERPSGSAVLVGSRLVVTAAHNIPWLAKTLSVKFIPAYFNGTSLYGPNVESYVTDILGWKIADQVIIAGYDWAILRLEKPLGSWLGYFGANTYSENWNNYPYWSVIGYAKKFDKGEKPSFQGGVTIGDMDYDHHGGRELESWTADVSAGNSGGPIFGWWGDDVRVVGVLSGQESWGGSVEDFFEGSFSIRNVFAGGPGFTDLVAWGRWVWPA